MTLIPKVIITTDKKIETTNNGLCLNSAFIANLTPPNVLQTLLYKNINQQISIKKNNFNQISFAAFVFHLE